MKCVIVSDLHFGKNYYDYYLNTDHKTKYSLNENWSYLTQRYIFEIIDKQALLCNEEITFIFLGDTIDQPKLMYPTLNLIEEIIERILDREKWKIVLQLGNHDTSSYKGDWSKSSLSSFCNYDSRLTVLNSPKIIEKDNFILFYLPYVRYVDLIPVLWANKKYTTNKNVYLFSHNYIYVADSFITTPTISIQKVQEILDCKSLFVFNGHLHVTHYESGYFQLGSVSPTSFKENPFASGACFYELGTDNYTLYKNLHIVFFSITEYLYIDKLKNLLKQCREYNTKVFIQYKVHLQLSISHICSLYSDVVVGLRCRDFNKPFVK